MSFRLLNRNQRRLPKEEELIQAEVRLREAAESIELRNCPTFPQLRSFVAGEYPDGDPIIENIMDHLRDCDSCLGTMTEIRRSTRGEKQIPQLGRSRLFLAAAAMLALAAICFWAIRTRTPSTAVAIVDLRQVTRSGEAPLISLSSQSRSIRVLLPGGSVGGNYEIGIFGLAAPLSPMLSDSARSTVENADTVIVVPISLNKVPPGPYLLGVRYSGSEWKQYAVTIK
ncbi:MAG TPA: hypothetical protein VI685_20410 [Candidatus Angelobacter sp.]